jgi:hypothetical protein
MGSGFDECVKFRNLCYIQYTCFHFYMVPTTEHGKCESYRGLYLVSVLAPSTHK